MVNVLRNKILVPFLKKAIQQKKRARELEEKLQELQNLRSEVGASTHEVSASVDQMTSNVSSISDSMSKLSSTVSTSLSNSEAIFDIANALDGQAKDQLEALNVMGPAINQVFGTINVVAEQSKVKAQKMHELVVLTDASKQSVNESDKIIKTIGFMTEDMLRAIDFVWNTSEKIKMLYINAATQAARKGDEGFMVVANELKKHSEDASKQSQTIIDNLNKIVGFIKNLLIVSNSLTQSFNSIGNETQEVSALFEQIIGSVEEVAKSAQSNSEGLDIMRDIAENLHNSSSSLKENVNNIKNVITNINNVTNEVTDAMKETKEGIKEISKAMLEISGDANRNCK